MIRLLIADSHEPEHYRLAADTWYDLKGKGDYWIVKDAEKKVYLRIERKSWSDLISSLNSGKLNTQLDNVHVLIIDKSENMYIPSGRGELKTLLSSESLLDVINGIALHTPVILTAGKGHLFKTMRRWERKINEGNFAELPVRGTRYQANVHVKALMAIDKMGYNRASQIINEYGSVQAALSHLSDLRIDGVGEKLKEAWQNELRPTKPCPCGERH